MLNMLCTIGREQPANLVSAIDRMIQGPQAIIEAVRFQDSRQGQFGCHTKALSESFSQVLISSRASASIFQLLQCRCNYHVSLEMRVSCALLLGAVRAAFLATV